jgi:transposase
VVTLILGTTREEGVLMGRPSKFSPEFREQAVELVRATGKRIAEVARDLQMDDTTLGDWVKADRAERRAADRPAPGRSGRPPARRGPAGTVG